MEVRAVSADDVRPLRHSVLRPEQSWRETAYPGDDDPATVHLGAFEDGRLVGIVTDRDLVVRVLAVGGGPDDAIRQAVSTHVVTVSPTDTIERAAQLMSDNAVRRLPVVVDDVVVGVVSIGDLAIERDPDSALADISAADPNN